MEKVTFSDHPRAKQWRYLARSFRRRRSDCRGNGFRNRQKTKKEGKTAAQSLSGLIGLFHDLSMAKFS